MVCLEARVRQSMRRWIRVGAVAEKLGQSVSQTWEDVKRREGFPQPMRRSARMTLFDEQEVDIFMLREMASRDGVRPEDVDAYVERELARQRRIAALAEAA